LVAKELFELRTQIVGGRDLRFGPTIEVGFEHSHVHLELLVDLGAHPKAISERMDHTEIGVTMNVYGHLYEGKQRELTEDLNNLLDRTRDPAVDSTPKSTDR
jgi:hypothetical protein